MERWNLLRIIAQNVLEGGPDAFVRLWAIYNH